MWSIRDSELAVTRVGLVITWRRWYVLIRFVHGAFCLSRSILRSPRSNVSFASIEAASIMAVNLSNQNALRDFCSRILWEQEDYSLSKLRSILIQRDVVPSVRHAWSWLNYGCKSRDVSLWIMGSLLIIEYPGIFSSVLDISFLSLDSDRPKIWKFLPEFSKIEEISEILLWAWLTFKCPIRSPGLQGHWSCDEDIDQGMSEIYTTY